MALKPVELGNWLYRDFPYHKYSWAVILQEIIDWLYEQMGPAQAGPMPIDPPEIYYGEVLHYGKGWFLERRHMGSFRSNGETHHSYKYCLHFETDAHEVMFRLVWR